MTTRRRETQQARLALAKAAREPAERPFHYKGTDPIPCFNETIEQYHARILESRKELEK